MVGISGGGGYRTMSCADLMKHLADLEADVRQGGQVQPMKRQLAVLVREVNRRCPAILEPNVLQLGDGLVPSRFGAARRRE